MNRYGLGYGRLNKDEQLAYELFEDAMKQYAVSCDITKISRKINIMRVLTTVLGDNPDILYFNKTRIRTLENFWGRQMNFTGCLDKRQAEQYGKQLGEALEDAVWKIDKGARDDREILMKISEFLQKNVRYDMDELKSLSRGKSKSPVSHNAYGALVNHRAVCDGFSSAFSLLAQYFGMKCMIVEGNSSYRSSSRMEHAWNIVEYQGNCFHIDVTWDANTYETLNTYSYEYFGLNDDEIAIDHEWDCQITPRCNSQKLSYFMANNMYAYSESQIEDIVYKHMKNGEKAFQLKISPSVPLGNDAQKYLEEKTLHACARSGIASRFRYIWREATRYLIIILE